VIRCRRKGLGLWSSLDRARSVAGHAELCKRCGSSWVSWAECAWWVRGSVGGVGYRAVCRGWHLLRTMWGWQMQGSNETWFLQRAYTRLTKESWPYSGVLCGPGQVGGSMYRWQTGSQHVMRGWGCIVCRFWQPGEARGEVSNPMWSAATTGVFGAREAKRTHRDCQS
jgi:hypothetical protein